MKHIHSKFINCFFPNENQKNWIIGEKLFTYDYQAKFETIFSIGNGFISSRGYHEENIGNKHLGTFITGTFNTVSGPEVPEIPNAPDVFEFCLKANNEYINCSKINTNCFNRHLNIKHGLLNKSYCYNWIEQGKQFALDITTQRFIHLDNLNLLMQKIIIKSNNDVSIYFKSGINGQVTNSGANHFEDTYSQYIDNVLNYIFTTTQSKIHFFYHKQIKFFLNNKEISFPSTLSSVYGYSRRTLKQVFNFILKKDDVLEIELYSTIHTSNDLEYLDNKVEDYLSYNNNLNEKIIQLTKERYHFYLSSHIKSWEKYWLENEIKIDTYEDFDVLASRFAQYQTRKFTPYHDYRCNIEAKGMVGEEYKGHTFWDTEIFIFPYFLYTQPQIAKQLLEHRYFVKNSAKIKAKKYGYLGFMWPWETSWINDGETCPTWGAVDRKEGHRIKVWPAFNQHHIASCIFWAFDQYYKVTNDLNFMLEKGFEILINTALFWYSRLELDDSKDIYFITKVIGPNEYKENIDNNVFTNYMAWFCIKRAIEYIEFILEQKLICNFSNFDLLLELKNKFLFIVNKIYLPTSNENGIIPENDTFLSLKEIDMDFYKKNPDQLWKDYTFPEMNFLQTLKQADLIALFYTLGFIFDKNIIEKNWIFYEHRCLHHSSLSLSLHAVTANYLSIDNLAYEFFEKAILIDLGPNMSSSDNGIHAASIGGILKIIIEGFGGIKNWDNNFSISPNLPKKWKSLNFNFYYQNQLINIFISHDKTIFKNLSSTLQEVSFLYRKEKINFIDYLEIDY